MAGLGEVDDREPPVAETDPTAWVKPFTGAIRPAMGLRIAQPDQLSVIDSRCPAMMNDARDATHALGK